MPYDSQETRDYIDAGGQAWTPGALNYQITKIVDDYVARAQGQLGPLRYAMGNEAVGVMECAKLEFYRRILAPLEDAKREQNGDVYTVRLPDGEG